MRCDKMHATIAVKQCLDNQGKLAGSNWLNQRGPYYPGCKGCETGMLARRGKLNDDDLRAILDGYRLRAHPPADVVSEGVRGEVSGVRGKPEGRAHRQSETAAESMVVETADNQDRDGKMEKTQPEAGNVQVAEETKRKCTKCRKPKPIERFSRVRKGEEKRKPICVDCETAYQRDRKARIRAAAERVNSEQLKREPQNIEHPTAEGRRGPEQWPAGAAVVWNDPEEREGKQVEPAPRQETPAPVVPQDEDQILENQILLDFSCYPEVLKEIKRIAHHEERPVEVQARFMLKRLLQDGWGDEVGSAGGRCPVPLPHY